MTLRAVGLPFPPTANRRPPTLRWASALATSATRAMMALPVRLILLAALVPLALPAPALAMWMGPRATLESLAKSERVVIATVESFEDDHGIHVAVARVEADLR